MSPPLVRSTRRSGAWARFITDTGSSKPATPRKINTCLKHGITDWYNTDPLCNHLITQYCCHGVSASTQSNAQTSSSKYAYFPNKCSNFFWKMSIYSHKCPEFFERKAQTSAAKYIDFLRQIPDFLECHSISKSGFHRQVPKFPQKNAVISSDKCQNSLIPMFTNV